MNEKKRMEGEQGKIKEQVGRKYFLSNLERNGKKRNER